MLNSSYLNQMVYMEQHLSFAPKLPSGGENIIALLVTTLTDQLFKAIKIAKWELKSHQLAESMQVSKSMKMEK